MGGNKLGVLVVDDEEDARELLAEVLTTEGYHSIMARDGQEALDRLAFILPDLVITDLDMPVMDGAQLLRRLSADARFAAIPAIVLTGTERAHAVDRIGETPRVSAILVKPVRIETLLAAVTAAIAAGP